MARKQANASSSSTNGDKIRSPSPAADRPLGPLAVIVPPAEREEVKVNNANVTELKNACDDAIKRFLARPELFKQIHLHTDVRLALGWLSVFVAAGTAFYGYKFDFETSKPVVTIGICVYIALTTLATLYAYFVEGDTVFVGKRKTFSKRIITERISISSSALPAAASPPAAPAQSSVSPVPNTPSYAIGLHYIRSTNKGKSLLGKGRAKGSAPFTQFFDEQGVMDQEAFERWAAELVEGVMDGKAA